MLEAVSDTGPLLHLYEIGQLPVLSTIAPLTIPDLVLGELGARGVTLARVTQASVACSVTPVAESAWRGVLGAPGFARLQPADAQVFCLVRSSGFQCLALTDDLALRRLLEQQGTTVVGSIGLLVRAYTTARLSRIELDQALDALLTKSTLHVSRAFRAYLRGLFAGLP